MFILLKEMSSVKINKTKDTFASWHTIKTSLTGTGEPWHSFLIDHLEASTPPLFAATSNSDPRIVPVALALPTQGWSGQGGL